MIRKPLALGLGAAVALAMIAVNIATQSAQASPTTIVSTPVNPNGWYTEDGAPSYVSTPPTIDGLGELEYNTPMDASKMNYFHLTGSSFFTGVPLAGVSGVSYSVRNNSGGPEAAYDMEVLTAGTTGYTTLVWEPYNNGHPLVANGAWNVYANLEAGKWWSTHIANPLAGSQSSPQPLSFFQGLYPNATAATYGVGQGSHNAGSISFVDDVSFEGTTTNFEVATASDCRARAIGEDSPQPVIFGQANGPEVPCRTDSSTVAKVSVGIPAIDTSLKLTGLDGSTAYGSIAGIPTAAASADVADVTIELSGLTIKVTGLRSKASATLLSCDGVILAGSSSVAKLVVGTKTYKIGDKPFTLSLPLKISLTLNQHIVSGGRIIQRALYLTEPDHRYNIALGESIAGLSC